MPICCHRTAVHAKLHPRRAASTMSTPNSRPFRRRPAAIPIPFSMTIGGTLDATAPTLTVVRDEKAALRRLLSLAETWLRAMPARRFAALVAAFALAAFAAIIVLSTGDGVESEPLAITDVTASLDYSGGMRVLSVYGSIDNSSSALQRLPLVVVDVVSNGRKVTATRLMPEGAAIAPGESRRFVTRLPYAGGKMPEVKVSFAENGVSVR